MDGIPLNNGRYADLRAAASSPDLIVLGQADRTAGRGHLYVRHRQYTWRNVVDGVAVTPLAGAVTIPGLVPGVYRIEWWDPWAGVASGVEDVASAGSDLTLTLPAPLSTAIAARFAPLAVADLRAARATGGVALRWTDLGGSVQRYEVWRSARPAFLPGDPDARRIDANVAPMPGGEVAFADANSHLGDPMVNDVYVVVAVVAGQPSAPSNRVGEFDFGLTAGRAQIRIAVEFSSWSAAQRR